MESPPADPSPHALVPYRPAAPGELDGLPTSDLSDWFNPFLPYFIDETLRGSGTVRVDRSGGSVRAIVLDDPVERTTSVFTRSPEFAAWFAGQRGDRGFYSSVRLPLPLETFGIYVAAPESPEPGHRYRHAVRRAAPADLPQVLGLLREVYGSADEHWFEGLDRSRESCFIAEVGGRLAGAGWVSVVGAHARLHSLAVRASARRLGLGTDLLFARLEWARGHGARNVLSEIADANAGSRAVAARGGMVRAGEIYLYPPAAIPGAP
jgi:GNAT superfamily N-acetyltransferase